MKVQIPKETQRMVTTSVGGMRGILYLNIRLDKSTFQMIYIDGNSKYQSGNGAIWTNIVSNLQAYHAGVPVFFTKRGVYNE